MSPELAPEAAPSGPLRRVGIGLAYDGTGFHGFAAQPGQRTIAGELLGALEVFGAPQRLVCAGRTDAGVHATAQVVHVDLEQRVVDHLERRGVSIGEDLDALRRALNARLGREVRVWRVRAMPEDFDARRAALARTYRYTIATGPADPLERDRVWDLGEELDLSTMRLAIDSLIGEHDFTSFCRPPADRPDASLVRRVFRAHVERSGSHVVLELEANAFCHQMVRSITGVVVAIGLGRLPAAALFGRMRARSREGAPTLAPPAGLCLVALRYPDAFGGTWRLSDGTVEQGFGTPRFASPRVLL